MELMVLILRASLFAVVFFGVCCLCNRYWKAPAAFVPILVCSLTACLMMLAGILNILRIMPWLFVLVGLYGLVTAFGKGTLPGVLRNPAIWAVVAASIYFLFYFYGHFITAGDDFNHWAIVPRVMLRYHRLPRFTDTIMMFPSYPTGSACFIYLVCSILGTQSDGMMLFSQVFLLLCSVLPLFAFVRRNRPLGYCVIAFSCLLLLTMNAGSTIRMLYVDTLMPLVCFAGFCIGYYYRNDLASHWFMLLPVACFLAVLKGSGIFFTAVLLMQTVLYVRKCPDKRQKWRCILYLIGIPVCLLVLWNRHADFAFESGLMTRHSTSLRYMLQTVKNKSIEDYRETLRAFWATLTNLSAMTPSLVTFGLLLSFSLLGKVCCQRTEWKGSALMGAAFSVYALYLCGLLGMYLVNLPENSIEAFPRYVGSILLLLLAMGILYLLDLINALPETPVRVRYIFCVALVVQFAAFSMIEKPRIRDLFSYPVEEETAEKALAACMPELDKETRYLVYIWDGHREQTYGHRMVHYVAYPAQSDIISIEDNGLETLSSWTEEYDYFIAFWPDDAYRDYALSHNLDPNTLLWTPEAFQSAYRP